MHKVCQSYLPDFNEVNDFNELPWSSFINSQIESLAATRFVNALIFFLLVEGMEVIRRRMWDTCKVHGWPQVSMSTVWVGQAFNVACLSLVQQMALGGRGDSTKTYCVLVRKLFHLQLPFSIFLQWQEQSLSLLVISLFKILNLFFIKGRQISNSLWQATETN